MSWSIALVVPNKEMMCCIDMERLNINSYLPVGTKWTRPKKKHKLVKSCFYPFPGYIFVQHTRDNYLHLQTVRGFRRVLFENVRDDLVKDVRTKQDAGVFDIDLVEKPRNRFKRDEMVYILVGPFVGMSGKVEKDTRGNFWAWLNVSGMRVKIFVDFIRKM